MIKTADLITALLNVRADKIIANSPDGITNSLQNYLDAIELSRCVIPLIEQVCADFDDWADVTPLIQQHGWNADAEDAVEMAFYFADHVINDWLAQQ